MKRWDGLNLAAIEQERAKVGQEMICADVRRQRGLDSLARKGPWKELDVRETNTSTLKRAKETAILRVHARNPHGIGECADNVDDEG
jgi:hypothetical protein